MASEKLRRENVTEERKVDVEKDRVPKMATHFESLAEKAKGQPHDVPAHTEVRTHSETIPVREEGKVKEEGGGPRMGQQMHGTEEKEHQKGERRGMQEESKAGGKEATPSLEEVSDLRATAQQNSIQAIRAAEERYEKAKESAAQAKDTSFEGTGRHHDQQRPKESAAQDKDISVEGMQTGAQYAAEKGGAMKDTPMEKTMQAKDYTMEKGQQAMDYTTQKAKEAKDVLSTKGQTAAEYTAEKARAAKDTAVDTTVTAAGYVGEKAAAAKDVTVESGKGAAGYAGKVAAGVKDQAVVAGWGAAHYTLEKVAEATKAVAGVTSSVAGYTGEKAAVAGKTVAGFAGEKLTAAKDVVVSTEEKAAEYAARKREEAKTELEAKKSEQGDQGEGFGMETGAGTGTFIGREQQHETKERVLGKPVEKTKETFQGGGGSQEGEVEQQIPKQGGTVLHAIGETLVEIGQTTKEPLVGQYPSEVMERKDEGGDVHQEYKDTAKDI